MNPENHAFGRAYRLADADDYGVVFKRGQRAGSRWFKGLAGRNELGHPRLGLAISRRIARRAVDRNRLKRTIREYFRRHRRGLGPFDFVILAKDGAACRPAAELESSLEELFNKLTAERATARAH